jgi:hypothetical protein
VKYFVHCLSWWMLVVSWLAGIVLAHGWWTVLAALFPFYAWYLVIERLMSCGG